LKNGKARIKEIISDGKKYNEYFVKKGMFGLAVKALKIAENRLLI